MKLFLRTYKHRLVAGVQTLWASSTGSAALGGVHFLLGKATPPAA